MHRERRKVSARESTRLTGRRTAWVSREVVWIENDEHIEQPKGGRGHREEVDAYCAMHVVPQESAPSLRRRFRSSTRHVARDRRLAHGEAEFEQLSVDPRCAPPMLSPAMRRIRLRVSGPTDGRSVVWRLLRAQYSANPLRCHAMTVAGFTSISARRQSGHHRARATQNVAQLRRSPRKLAAARRVWLATPTSTR